MLKNFIEFARARVPAKHQRPYKKMLLEWSIALPPEERTKLATNLTAWKNKTPAHWALLANDMFTLYQKRGLPSG